jgi:diguanylate cyclase (GGDEF)-like protein
MRILVVDDDDVVAQALALALGEQHYAVDLAADGEMGWNHATTCQYDVIVLDIMLPRLSGIQFCQKLRSSGNLTPILLLTAQNKGDLLIEGLDSGADDYVTKPFNLMELLARIRALLRRGQSALPPKISWGELKLDPSLCEVAWQDRPMKLTPKEYNLMELLLRNPQRIYSSSALIDHLWSLDSPPSEDTIRSHVKGLRQKLKSAGVTEDPIETVYGVGYRLRKLSEKTVLPASVATASVTTSVATSVATASVATASVTTPPLPAVPLPAVQVALNQAALAQVNGLNGVETADPGESPILRSPSPESIIADGMERLWKQSQGMITDRLTCIHQALAAAQRNQLDHTLAMNGEAAAHKLVGSLGMFGGDRGSVLAKEVESWFEQSRSKSPLSVTILEQILIQLRQEIDRLNQTPMATTLLMAPGFPKSQKAEGKIMVMNDDPALLRSIVPILQPWGFEVISLPGNAHLLDALQLHQPDLLILDVELTPLSGIALCKTLRSTSHWVDLPILFLTAQNDSDTLHRVFAVGADDCVSKPFVGPELVTRILNRLERSRLLRSLAETDPLTGVTNRRAFMREAQTFLRLCERHHKPLALAIVEIHRFKSLNDQYGDAAGDEVLQCCAQILRSGLRQEDLVGRWSTTKFVMVMYGTGIQGVSQRLSEALMQLRRKTFNAPEGKTFEANFHIGLSEYHIGESFQDLYDRTKQTLQDSASTSAHFWNRTIHTTPHYQECSE